MKKLSKIALLSLLCVVLTANVAYAVSFRISDDYIGGGWANSAELSADKDVVGSLAGNDVFWMDVDITGNFMSVNIHTNYTPHSRTNSTYGDLFISVDGWNPYGTDPYLYDTYANGEQWEYAFSGRTGGLYDLSGSQDNILLSNDLPTYHGVNSWRRDQEVWVDSTNLTAIGQGSVEAISGSWYNMSFDISGMMLDMNNLNLGFHWTETCGNDVIEGGYSQVTSTPEPSTLLLLGSGMLGAVAVQRKRAKKK